MNEQRILEMYPAGDPEARSLVAAARQLEIALGDTIPWSVPVGVLLVLMLSYRRFEFRDGTILGEASDYRSIIGKREAAWIAAALDPEDRGGDFWHHAHVADYESPEMLDLEARIPMVLSAAGIKID